jgi:hypothetical protein|tara:strand:- start:303 stop:587 length:285 start_codon:yes stop_codon:yes gene_type:complete
MRVLSYIFLCLAITILPSCAAMESVWDTTVSVFDSDTGETAEVPLGDIVADSSEEVGGIVSSLLSTHPLLAAVGGAAAAAAAAGAARRKKKDAA